MDVDVIGTVAAAVLTFFVFSYLLGDLPGLGSVFKFFYRLAMHVLVGAGVGYALAVAGWSVLYPRVLIPLRETLTGHVDPTVGVAATGVVLGGLLLFKLSRPLAWLGNIATGYLIGVGAGVAAGGAVLGTLFAQSQATWTLAGAHSLWDVLFLVLGTLTVFVAFTFTATGRKGLAGTGARVVQVLSAIGRVLVYVALGAAFAGVYVAGVSVFIGQVQFVLPLVLKALSQLGITL